MVDKSEPKIFENSRGNTLTVKIKDKALGKGVLSNQQFLCKFNSHLLNSTFYEAGLIDDSTVECPVPETSTNGPH